MSKPAIIAENLSKRFILRHNRSGELKVRFLGLFDKRKRETREEFWALQQISASIAHGEAVGVISRNGSGKSTFLKLVAGLHRPTSGRLLMARAARIGTMIELGVGFHGELTGQENVALNTSIHGLSKAEAEAIYPAIVAYSGLAHFMDVPIKNYSSGMHMRLGFAIAAHLDPDILLLDEVFAVGDAEFQQQCIRTVKEFRARGKTILFVSHSAASVRAICERVLVLEHGRLIFDGAVDDGMACYEQLQAATPPPADVEPRDALLVSRSRIAALGLLLALFAACAADRGPDPANELPRGVIDTPAAGTQLRPGPTLVGGWAIDDSGIAEIRIYFDDHFAARTTPMVPRPDVAKVFPAYARPGDRYGWNLEVDFGATPGPHTILAQAVDVHGATRDIGVVAVTGAR